ncbi:hypothetical protein JHK82_042388 [Glycine max]|nr:hypothetical protein JHK86_042430 [Glycine max]KAG4956678.1 hypothetical protein JHK85_043058 [Glycine max]KAG5105418.1 hypothetical protein JHK82_042388 [Glycine max]
MASPQTDLRKIALEGFDLIDKLYGRRGPANNDAFPGRREGFWVVHQVPNGDMDQKPRKNKDVVNYGVPVANLPRGKPQNRWAVVLFVATDNYVTEQHPHFNTPTRQQIEQVRNHLPNH